MKKQDIISILKNIYSLLAVIILVGFSTIFCLLKIKQEQDKLLGEVEPEFWCGTCATQYYERESNPEFSRGEELFKNNCVHCHAATTEIVVGPGLSGIRKRRSWKWIVKFTQNSQKFIKTNKEARKLYLQFNRTDMTSFEHLTEADIKAIFDYCEGN
jgi:mono/diheme cytochrome c family protein